MLRRGVLSDSSTTSLNLQPSLLMPPEALDVALGIVADAVDAVLAREARLMSATPRRRAAGGARASSRRAGALKTLREISSPQGPEIRFADGTRGDLPLLQRLPRPRRRSGRRRGRRRGPARVRRRNRLGPVHLRPVHAPRRARADLAAFLGTERAVTYVSCWNANQALLDTLCGKRTWVLSDELNHASIIDGIRLARPAGKAVYAHADVGALERELEKVPDGHRCLVVTDGVFSMEGDLAPLPEIVELTEAPRRDADRRRLPRPRRPRADRPRAPPSTSASPTASTSSPARSARRSAARREASSPAATELCELLEQRSRAQLFSNGLPQSVACGARAALGVLRDDPARLARLRENVARFRAGVAAAGLRPLEGESAIVPIVVGETRDAIAMSERLLDEGVFAIGFGYPVVPEGTAPGPRPALGGAQPTSRSTAPSAAVRPSAASS